MKSLSEISRSSYLTLEEIVKLEEFLIGTGYMTPEKARQEIEWFTLKLGIDEYYFKTTSIEDIAKHLIAISASELVSRYGGGGVGIQLISERDEKAVYIVEDESSKTEEIENRIERRYPMYRLESYRTKKKTLNHFLRFYIVTKPIYQKGNGEEDGIPFEDVANRAFITRSSRETIDRYRAAWESMNNRESPFIGVSDKPETSETRFMVGIHGAGTRQFLTNFSHLLYKYNIYSNRKYKEPFSDQKKVYTFYFNKMGRETIEEFSRDLNAVVMLPENPITKLFLDELYSSQETMYAISAAVFTHQFLTVLTEEYMVLNRALKDQPEAKGILGTIKIRMVKDTYSESRIAQAVIEHYDIVSLLYFHFVNKLHPTRREGSTADLERDITEKIEKNVPSIKDKTILKFFLTFNKMIQKTNFFMRDKTCMAFRLNPEFLSPMDFTNKPFGLFFFVGREFIGFHIRFRDIARGGVRIIKSRNLTWYENNLDTIFLENYNLALTQQDKNKEIPEGGSKGTILLGLENQEEKERAFKSYVDGMLDLIMPNEEVLDLYSEREILFLGPDEGTAKFMNWSALYARRRGYPFWKAFTTGKSPELGGIPHDMYGMTTIGLHEYTLGILEKLKLREGEIVKIQTGGPDGDLGSNEIMISRDKTIAVVDGSGVLYDPEGILRKELVRLARKRAMVKEFDLSLLSKRGFFVSIDDKDLKLPDGTVIPNGEEFRNRFHLHPLAKADLFTPCGGRPASININNWQKIFDERGNSKFKIIIEGANLFITEEARLRLEEHGIIVIKDASANKGGVNSSSFEVFCSLVMRDEEYEEHMMVRDGRISEFRKAYIEDIIRIIKSNSRAEFELLWKEHEEKGIPFTLLSNRISGKINSITDGIFNSDLPRNIKVRERVVMEYTPKPLMDLVGIENIINRVPEGYINSLIATRIATGFVYAYGLESGEVDFYNYIETLSS